MESVLVFILGVTFIGTVLGSLIGVLKKPSHKFMHYLLAFAGGVLISISFLDLIPESIEFSSVYVASLGIVVGAFLMYGFSRILILFDSSLQSQDENCKLKRTSIYLVFSVFLHNFPAGMAIALGTVTDIRVSFVIAIAIAIHNFPEGIYTAAPLFKATGKRMRSFLISSSTIIPLFVGFALAYFVFGEISGNFLGLLIGLAAGVMIYVSADELIPGSCRDNKTVGVIFSFILGVLFVVLLRLV